MINTLDFICIRVNNGMPELLLHKRLKEDEPHFNEYALIGGMVWEKPIEGSDVYDRNIEEASERIIRMKAPKGFSPSYKEQLLNVGSKDRDSRDWSQTTPFLCLFRNEETIEFDSQNDLYKWVSLKDVVDNKIKLPFDHNELVKKALNSMVIKARYSSVLFFLLNRSFTVTDIIRCFSCFGFNITKQTITKRWINNGLINPSGQVYKEPNTRGKAASLYNLANEELNYFEFSLGV